VTFTRDIQQRCKNVQDPETFTGGHYCRCVRPGDHLSEELRGPDTRHGCSCGKRWEVTDS
jgi:hypothetical protein